MNSTRTIEKHRLAYSIDSLMPSQPMKKWETELKIEKSLKNNPDMQQWKRTQKLGIFS